MRSTDPKLKVLIAAGGSGGHLFPAQQLAELLKPDCEIAFAGHKLRETPFFTRREILFWDIACAQPQKKNWLRFIASSWRGFWQSISLLRKFRPDIVVGFGSYHAFPVLLAATVLRKKMVLYEANCILGKVNRMFLFAAKQIALQFPLDKRLEKGIFVPYLPWSAMPRKRKLIPKQLACAYFGLDPNLLTFLIFGGSQGAAFLNETMPKVLTTLQRTDIQVIHLTGKNRPGVDYGPIPSRIKEFEKDMEFAYSAADLAICRSGAITIAELIQNELPALLIPFPHSAENHQWKNGQFLERSVKGARLLSQKDASPEKIADEIEKLLQELEEKKTCLNTWNQKTTEKIDFGVLLRAVGESKTDG